VDLAIKTVLQTLVHTIVSHAEPKTAQAIEDALFKASEDLTAENFHVEAGEVQSIAEAAVVAQDNKAG